MPLATDAVQVTVRGDVPGAAPDYARSKVAALADRCRDPILVAEVRLTQGGNPAQERPATAEATLDVNGRPVRAQVAARDMLEAVDLLQDRLSRRLVRYAERLHRVGRERNETGRPADGAWRHGDLPTQRPEHFPRPRDERELVRSKRIDLPPMTVDEAAFDLDMSGHDVYLFTELATGADAVVSYRDDGRLGVQRPEGVGDPGSADAVEVVVGPPASTLTVEEAIERLEAAREPFVFFVAADSGRGAVVYHRYDGHWGLITST